MPGIPFIRDFKFDYGTAMEVTPHIRRVVARNPGPFTFKGTGTYIIGHGKVAIVDPGPDQQDHIDHVPATPAVAKATGAKVYSYGPHPKPPEGVAAEQEGDFDFAPDIKLNDGDVIEGDGWNVEAVYTPGHISNHLCFAVKEDNVLLSGDHVMGWSTAVISPPDGNMADYFASLRKLLPRKEALYIPTHGAEIREPVPFVNAYIEHRLGREDQIISRLKEGPQTIPQMVARNYADTPIHLHAAAGRSMLAHLVQMVKDGRVKTEDGRATIASTYRL